MNPWFNPLSVYIRIEDKLDFLVIEQYSMVKLLSELGGLASILFGLSRILTQKVAKNWFIGELIEKLFRVRERVPDQSSKKRRNSTRLSLSEIRTM